MFSAPIPGQSLTSEPKNSPWENPPQMNKPEEAVLWHLKKLDKPKSVKSVVGLLGLGLDLVTLTEGLLRGAVAEGRHSICLLYTSPSPRDRQKSRMPSSA